MPAVSIHITVVLIHMASDLDRDRGHMDWDSSHLDWATRLATRPESLRFSTSEAYVVDLSGDEIDLLNYRNGKTLSLMNDFEVAVGDISAFQLLLSESNQMLTGTNLEGEDESIIILDDNGDPADHLVFAGQRMSTCKNP